LSFTLGKVTELIELALNNEPHLNLIDLYDDYYFPYYNLLYLLASKSTWGIAVELGVEKGRGIASLAQGSSGRVIGLDNNVLPEIQEVIDKFPNFTFLHLPSLPPPEEYINGKCISILHIDTEHSYSMANAEFEAYEPHLLSGAVVCFDDLHAQDDAVLKYFMELPYPKIQNDRLHPVCGYGVLIYEQ